MQRVFEICFAAVAMVFGGVSLLTNQSLYRFLVKPRFYLGVFFQQFGPDQSVCGALRRRPIVWTISRLGFLSNNMRSPIPNFTCHSGGKPYKVTSSIDVTPVCVFLLKWTLLPSLNFYQMARGFQRTFAMGVAC